MHARKQPKQNGTHRLIHCVLSCSASRRQVGWHRRPVRVHCVDLPPATKLFTFRNFHEEMNEQLRRHDSLA